MTKKPTAAIYARVSTQEQTAKNQLRDLKAYAQKRGLRVAHELVDQESGAKADRAQLNFLMELARKRQIDVVLVWKFDRFARSTTHLLQALEEFRALGVDFISYTENVDTSTPMGKVVFTMVSAIAEFERDLIRERVKAGLARARAEGKRLGRPGLSLETVKEIKNLRKKKSVRQVAEQLGLSPSVVGKYS